MQKYSSVLFGGAILGFIFMSFLVTKINAGYLEITTTLPDATAGQPYSHLMQATGGTPPYRWTTVSTTYPSACCILGLSGKNGSDYYGQLDPVYFDTQSGSTISTNYTGTYSWTIKVTDSVGNSATKILNLKINPAPQITITTTSLPDATIGQPYSTQIQVSGGTAPYTWTTLSTTYPSACCILGLNGNSQPIYGNSVTFDTQSGSKVISTYPAGTYFWTIQVKDANGSIATKTISLNIKNPEISYQNIIGPTSAFINSDIIYQFGAAYNTQDTNLTYKINWGDGQVTQDVGPNNTTATKSFSHKWTSSGIYTITFTACLPNNTSATCGVKTLSVKVSDISGSSGLIPSDTFVSFNVRQGESNPPVYNLHLTNSSSANINYTISVPNQPTWLNCSYSTQTLTLAPGQVAGVCVAVDASKVSAPNTYKTNLIISGNFINSPITIPITLVVSPASTPTITPTPSSTPSSIGINLPDGALIKLPNNPTVYLVSGGQLKPFTSADEFLSQGYKWTDVQQVSPNQVIDVSGFYPYPTGSLINDGGTVYFISGHTKIPFTSYDAFVGLGYSFLNVIEGDLTNYTLSSNYAITSRDMAHPWGSWLIHQGTVYYSTQDGLIGIPSAPIFSSNGGSWNLLVKANSYDMAAPKLSPMVLNDPRVQK